MSSEVASAPAPLALNASPSSRPGNNISQKDGDAGGTSAGMRPSASAGSAGTSDVPDITSPHELTAWVEDVLNRLETSFETMSTQILDRLEGISTRIDTVEQSISDLMDGTLHDPTPASQSSPNLAGNTSGSRT